MGKRVGFKNIQIQAKQDLADLFEDTYEQSRTNSKAEFLGVLLDDYLNPDTAISNKAIEMEKEKNDLSEQFQSLGVKKEELDTENILLKNRIAHYENEILSKLFEKHKGKKLKFSNTSGKRVEIEIKDLTDVYTALINSIEM